jgi:hypothetical protein
MSERVLDENRELSLLIISIAFYALQHIDITLAPSFEQPAHKETEEQRTDVHLWMALVLVVNSSIFLCTIESFLLQTKINQIKPADSSSFNIGAASSSSVCV